MYISFMIRSVRKGIFLLTLAVFISFPGSVTAQEISFPELQGYKKGSLLCCYRSGKRDKNCQSQEEDTFSD
jgi:hypothetical protein